MRLAVAIAGENAPSSAFVVWRGIEASIKKAKMYGYHGVELALKSADDVNPRDLSKWIERSDIEISCISTGQVFSTLGLYFTHPDPDARRRTIDVFSGIIGIAKDFGKMVNIGRARGFVAQGQTREEAEKLFIEMAEEICMIADKAGVTIIIEPINRYESNFINNLDEGAALLSRLKAPNIGLMPDLFHMNIEDDRIGDSLIRNAAFIKYIHFADSNRQAPGKGHLDFDDVFRGLKSIHYSGWATIEILPQSDPDAAAKQAAEFMAPRIRNYCSKGVEQYD